MLSMMSLVFALFSHLSAISLPHSAILASMTFVVSAKPNRETFGRSQQKRAAANHGQLPVYSDKVQSYLMNFGYLPKPTNPLALTSRSSSEVMRALQRLQRFAGLEPTGRLDPETREVLAAKRCGMPDVVTGDFRPGVVARQPSGVARQPAGRDHRLRHRQHRAKRRRVRELSTIAEEEPGSPGGSDLKTVARQRTKRYLESGLRWHTTNLTFKVATYTNDISEHSARLAIMDALKVWSDASALTFSEVLQSDEADIIVNFYRGDHGDRYPFDGKDSVLAHAFYPGGGDGGDVHFDDDEFWSDSDQLTAYSYHHVNLFSVAVHEFGHSLGLAHSESIGAVMNPYYKQHGLRQTFKLPYDDAIAIQALYGRGDSPLPKPEDHVTTTPEIDSGSGVAEEPEEPSTAAPDHPPSPCDSHLDAVARIRREIFVFKGAYFWRFDETGKFVERPSKIHDFWIGFSDSLDRIDAVYEEPRKDKVVFFRGNRFWEFKANYISRRTPAEGLSLTDLGLPAGLKKIDAAFVWDYNLKTYFFTGDEYYRFDEDDDRIELEYPRKMRLWKDVPHNLDAAFTGKNGITYFFKNDKVYQFNNYFMKVEKGWPRPISNFWAHCGGREMAQSPNNLRRPPWQTNSVSRQTCQTFLAYIIILMMTQLRNIFQSELRIG